jgi:hypothetical protein
MLQHVVAGFAKYFQITYDSILHQFILQKGRLIHNIDIANDAFYRLPCVPGSPPGVAGLCSHRDCLSQYCSTEFFGQRPWRQDVNWDTEQLQQLVPDRADVEQRGFRCGIDQHIEVAAFLVTSLCDRAENTRIARAVSFHDTANGRAVRLKSV